MKKKKLGFNIVLLGMIASGKDTQANLLKEKYILKSVETGVYSRKLMKEKSKDGDIGRRTTAQGKPLHTKLLQKFLKKEIENKPKNKDLLFLGGRLKPEAQLIRRMLRERGEDLIAFYIKLPEKEVYRRSRERIKKENLKEVYKVLDKEKLIPKRIKWHKEQVRGKTVEYYKKQGIMHIINGNQSIKKVYKDINKVIKEHYKKTQK
jgi:adenylate kinase